jgi:hypothetical protein
VAVGSNPSLDRRRGDRFSDRRGGIQSVGRRKRSPRQEGLSGQGQDLPGEARAASDEDMPAHLHFRFPTPGAQLV